MYKRLLKLLKILILNFMCLGFFIEWFFFENFIIFDFMFWNFYFLFIKDCGILMVELLFMRDVCEWDVIGINRWIYIMCVDGFE